MSEGNKSLLNSNWQTFFLLVKGNIGPGCLALPYSFSMLGTHGSIPFLFVVAVLCIANMWLLVECKKKVPGVKTYGELGLCVLGRRGEIVIEVFLTLSQLSICCVYFSFISNGIAPLFGISNRIVIALLVVPIAIISQYRHMRELAPLSIIASLLLVGALSIIGVVCVRELSSSNDSHTEMPVFDSSKIILFLVSTVYAFEGIGIILPIEGSMQHPDDFPFILAVSMTIVTIIYISFGEIVVMAFGFIEDAGITKYLVTVGSVPASLAAAISVLVSSAVLLSYPLQLYPALQVLEIYCNLTQERKMGREKELKQEEEEEESGQGGVHQFLSRLRGALVYFSLLKGSSDTEAEGGTAVIYESPEFKRKRKPTQIFSYQANGALNDNISSHAAVLHQSHSLSTVELNRIRAASEDYMSEDLDFCSEDEHLLSNSSSQDCLDSTAVDSSRVSVIRSFLRIALVVWTASVAAFIPNIGMLVSLAGATSGTSLALIFPPVFEVLISRQQHIGISNPRWLFCLISICIGIVGAVLGTVTALDDILHHAQP